MGNFKRYIKILNIPEKLGNCNLISSTKKTNSKEADVPGSSLDYNLVFFSHAHPTHKHWDLRFESRSEHSFFNNLVKICMQPYILSRPLKKLYFLAQAYPRIKLRLLLQNSFLYSKINKYMGLRVLDFAFWQKVNKRKFWSYIRINLDVIFSS